VPPRRPKAKDTPAKLASSVLENRMKQMILALAGLTLAVCSGHAQVTIDVTKITCEKFRNYKMKTSDNIAIWLSGYYHGTQNETLDPQTLASNAKNLVRYCADHPEVSVMEAAKTVFGDKK
jgi:acid stress chaperone HdeB